jgi:hypothetical protein
VPPAFTLPSIHLNGSGRLALETQYEKALQALTAAYAALYQLDIHDRDYYPQGPDAGPRARREHRARLDKIESVRQDIKAVYESVAL